jgi:hypothetical protein
LFSSSKISPPLERLKFPFDTPLRAAGQFILFIFLEQFKYWGEYVKGWAKRDKRAGRSDAESEFRCQNKL